jgi:class 3 adenylate cyclase
MASLADFLPSDRRRALAEGRALPDRVRGAALFADMSGFTSLTGALFDELGRQRGAEEVIRQLNRVFDPLIVEVHRHGGNVVNFSGDAITCWFDEDDGVGTELTASLRAVACGLRLQQVMDGLEELTAPSGARFPLFLKVGVAAGTARRLLVGDPAQYVLEVLAGATLDRVAAAETFAGSGEVVISSRTLREIGLPVTVGEWVGAGATRYVRVTAIPDMPAIEPPPPPPPLDDASVRPWLLPPVFARLRYGADAFQAELRPSVALFLKFRGIDYDNDDRAGELLDVFVRRVQVVLNRYDGFLLQLTMGDKGSYLYASFGAPVAHENDRVRAAAAALELREVARSLDFLSDVQIGISFGTVHSGAYGSVARRTFGVVGNEVNISARLMTTAVPGQILVSERVAESLEGDFELRSLLPVRLKGVRGLFPVWELVGRRGASRPADADEPAAFIVGRESELSVLDAALTELAEGQSSVVVVEGAPGIGKSLLARELAARAAALALPLAHEPGDAGPERRPLVLNGNGDAVDRSTPYHGCATILSRLYGVDASDTNAPSPTLRERVLAELGPDRQPFAPLLNAVLPLGLAETDETLQLADEARQENTLRLVVELLRFATGGRPLALILDDAHWLDSPSWALLRRLQREIHPLLLMLVARPLDDTPSPYADFLTQPHAHRLTLDALPHSAVEQLVSRRLGVRALPRAVSELIRTKAEGNPFFSEELAYALRDARLIDIIDGELRLTPGTGSLEALDFPDTVQGVITSRIDLLPPQQQLTVKVASVIGRIFAFRVLRDVYPVKQEIGGLRENLATLERLDLTPVETPEPNLSHIFKHIVTQEVVYGLMTYAQRQQLHRETALWYEQLGEGDPGRTQALLAHHWRQAGDFRRAVSYYEQAGEAALRDYANEEAIRLLGAAVELSDATYPALQRARWHRLMAEAAYRLTRVEDSVAYYEQALRLLNLPVHASPLVSGARLVAELGRQGIHRMAPTRMVGRAGAEERELLLEASRIYESVSEVYYNRGDALGSIYAIMTSFNLAETAGPSPELARGYGNMTATFANVGVNRLAENYRTRALAVTDELDDPATKAWLLIPLGIYSLWIGRWDRAESEIKESLDIYARMGDWRRWAVAGWLWPQIAVGRGEPIAGHERWIGFRDTVRQKDDTRHQVRALGGLFFNHLSLGRAAEAWDCLDDVRALVDANPELLAIEERLWFAMNGTQALAMGDAARARAMAHEQIAAMGRARFKADLLEVFAAPAEVLLALFEQDACEAREAEDGCKALSQFARTYAFARPRAARARGRFAWLKGDSRAAEKHWGESLEQAERLRMPYERALTLRLMGRSLNDAAQAEEGEAQLLALGCDVSTLSAMD